MLPAKSGVLSVVQSEAQRPRIRRISTVQLNDADGFFQRGVAALCYA